MAISGWLKVEAFLRILANLANEEEEKLQGKGARKNRGKYGILPNQGSASVMTKSFCFFWGIFRECIESLTPQHVLHLVLSAIVISTAVRTALKANSGKKKTSDKEKNHNILAMGPSKKMVYLLVVLFPEEEKKGNFFSSAKRPHQGVGLGGWGGVPRVVWQKIILFLAPFSKKGRAPCL